MVFENVNEIYSILSLAHSIFFLDNMEEIKPFWENTKLRQESSLLDLINTFDMLGFSIRDYSIGENSVNFSIRDLTMQDKEKILNELLLFLRSIWYKTRKRFIKLKYYKFNGDPISIIEADTSKRKDIFIENVDENLLTLENIKDCIKITDLRVKK